jgi:uncharacterized membrane protein YbhN (UPF0104 family)
MSRARDLIKSAASIAIVGGVAFFFYRAFRRNWADIEAAQLKLDYPLLLLAAAFMLVCYLLSTYAWQATVNRLSRPRRLDFSESVATFNASGLTKYLPGKFWSYALQMYWLGGVGFSKSMVVYSNVVNLVISIVTSVLLGLVCLVFSSTRVPMQLVVAALALVVVVDLCVIKFYSSVFGGLVKLVNRWLKRDLGYFELSAPFMLELHVIYLLSGVAAGVSTYLVGLSIGWSPGPRDAALAVGSSLISDVIGFLAVIVPGGLGVREAVMYLMLNGVSLGSLSLVLPLASRAVNMLTDIGLGLVAILLLRSFMKNGAEKPSV